MAALKLLVRQGRAGIACLGLAEQVAQHLVSRTIGANRSFEKVSAASSFGSTARIGPRVEVDEPAEDVLDDGGLQQLGARHQRDLRTPARSPTASAHARPRPCGDEFAPVRRLLAHLRNASAHSTTSRFGGASPPGATLPAGSSCRPRSSSAGSPSSARWLWTSRSGPWLATADRPCRLGIDEDPLRHLDRDAAGPGDPRVAEGAGLVEEGGLGAARSTSRFLLS